MVKRRIYEIDQDELKSAYNLYREFVDDEHKENFGSRVTRDDEQIFSKGDSNTRFLENYINQLANIIEKNFIDTYIYNNINSTIFHFISQPFKQINNLKVFISHSHKDLTMVKRFAERIYEKFKVNCFVDSKFWPYFNDIIEKDVKKLYTEGKNEKLDLWETSKYVRDIIDIYLLEALQFQLLKSEIIIIIKTNNYSYKSPWIRFENNVIDYICKNENCSIQQISVRNLMNKGSI